MRLRHLVAAAAAILTCGVLLSPGAGSPAAASYYVPLRTLSGIPLLWKTLPVKFSINDQGSDNISDDNDTLAIRLAFAEWDELSGSRVNFTELTSVAAKKISDWRPFGSHIVAFDENGDPDILPAGSNIIGITPVAYDVATGKILDADIVLNGSDFIFSTSLVNGTMDVWATTTHEVGHFIGLDHTGIAGATMWPYEGTRAFPSRSLSQDEFAGARDLYPKGTPKASIQGTVKRASNSTTVIGAHVWARLVNDGRVVSGAFTDSLGRYTLTDLDPGTYRIVAGPLDGAMSGNNLSSFNKAALQSNFSPGETAPVAILAAETATAPDVLVGADVALNITAPQTPVTLHPGESVVVNLVGTGLTGAAATIPDSLGAFIVNGSAPSINLTAMAGTPAGIYDLLVTNVSGHMADWSGGIEVLPPPLTMSSVIPNVASSAGGTTIVVNGSNFFGAPTLIFGDVPATNVNVVSADRITATAPKHAPNTVAVTLVSESGEPVELVGPFYFVDGVNPGIASVFPSVGSDGGGTPVTISGSSFADGAIVKVGNGFATNVQFVSSTEIRALTPALAAETYDVLVVNPGVGGLVATALNGFSTVASADPTVVSATPDEVASVGGAAVSIVGTGFAPGVSLTLFANANTGTGGISAAPAFVDAQTLDMVAPANVKGSKSYVGEAPILVKNTTGQLAYATGLLTYVASMSKTGNLTAAVSPVADVDTVFVDTIAGTILTLTATSSGSPVLTPQITLRDPADTILATAGATGSKKATLTSVPLPSNGRYRVEIGGLDGTTGKYKFTFKEALPKSQTSIPIPVKPPTTVGPATAVFNFNAKAGSLVKGTITAKNGLLALVSTFDGPGGSILGDPDVASKIVVVNGGKSIQLKGVPLKLLGAYALEIGASGGTTGAITGTLTITPPKAISSFVEQ